jgi:mono/diheme cytochrome c family protein
MPKLRHEKILAGQRLKPNERSRLKTVWKVAAGVVATGLVIQAVPYGHGHINPPVVQEPAWDRAETRDLAKRACFNCHSNETVWPWYSNVAPVSWLVQSDVDDGRSHLDFSEFDRAQKHATDAAKDVKDGDMPPWSYLPMHAEAKLTAAEHDALANGLETTFGAELPPARQR